MNAKPTLPVDVHVVQELAGIANDALKLLRRVAAARKLPLTSENALWLESLELFVRVGMQARVAERGDRT